jgi:hypothetical protein
MCTLGNRWWQCRRTGSLLFPCEAVVMLGFLLAAECGSTFHTSPSALSMPSYALLQAKS